MDAADNLERYRAPALDKGLDILELLAETESGLSLGEIAKALERTPNEIYRMLDRLVWRGYVRRTHEDRYVVTLKLFELAYRTSPIRLLASRAMPVLRRFARDAGQSVHLVVHDRSALVVVAQVDGPGYWTLSIRIGSRIGLVNTGSGHIFLAFASEEERALMLEEQLDPAERRLPPKLQARLARVRKAGHEVMPSQQVASVVNLSIPIFGPAGSVIAALTCPYTVRLDKTDAPTRAEALELLLLAGNEISMRATPTET